MSLEIIQKFCLEVTAKQRRTKGRKMFFPDVEEERGTETSSIFRVLMAARSNVKEGGWGPRQQGVDQKRGKSSF